MVSCELRQVRGAGDDNHIGKPGSGELIGYRPQPKGSCIDGFGHYQLDRYGTSSSCRFPGRTFRELCSSARQAQARGSIVHLKSHATRARQGSAASPSAALELGLFGVVAVVAVVIFALRSGFSVSARDLIDTDGYMRYLRVQDLLEGGDWFNPMFARSNYPFGESLHWSRPLDAVVAVGALVLAPLLGDSALYFAAISFGPLSLILLGAATLWAFGGLMPAASRAILLPGLLALSVVVGYMVPGRVDHHAFLFVIFMITVGAILRVLRQGGEASEFVLAAMLALGLWVSPEFLVPVALVAVTLGMGSIRGGSKLATSSVRVFLLSAAVTLLAVLLERGSRWTEIDFARVSLVHPVLLAMIAAGFGAYVLIVRESWGPRGRFGLLAVSSLVAGAVVVAVFPKMLGGPFVDFHPVVKERWLYRVIELQSVLDWGVSGIALHLVWPVLALFAGGFLLLKPQVTRPHWLAIVYWWMACYVALSFYQVRWATFAQLLALPILVTSLAPLYRRFESMRSVVLWRPLLLACVIAAAVSVGPSLEGSSIPGVEASCELSDVLPSIATSQATTILAEQDVGPEILYRTGLNVVATPYGNEQAFLYTIDVMAERDIASVPGLLAQRDVGLVLVCPGRVDILRPENPFGTFYQALLAGPLPFVDPVKLPEQTDYRLFAVKD